MKSTQTLSYWSSRAFHNRNRNLKHFGLSGFVTPEIAPLFWIMSGAVVFCTAFCARSLSKNIDVSWQKEMTPQNGWEQKQFKMFNPRKIDYENIPAVPKY